MSCKQNNGRGYETEIGKEEFQQLEMKWVASYVKKKCGFQLRN